MPARPQSAVRLVLATIMFAALACGFGVGGPSTRPTPTRSASPSPATPAASATLSGRAAVLSDLAGDVSSGPAGGGKDVPATNGQTVNEGSQVRTGTQSKATVTLGDGTILRLRPDTLVTLSRLTTDPNNPVSQLLLALGKVFVILKGGQLEVQTPAGVAAVTGSFMSVEYQADANSVVVTCLEGNCTLRNDQGGAALTTGQAASLSGAAGSSPVLRWMTPAEIQGWLDDNPEAQAVAPLALTAIPTATSTGTAAGSTATPTPPASPTPTETATATAPSAPSPTSAPAGGLPIVSKFTARFVAAVRSTFYTVTAADPAGGALTYAWSNTNKCGQFKAGNAPTAEWNHPDVPGGCPVEAVHPGVITVVISNAAGSVTCQYASGSADGDAARCAKS